MDAKSVIFMYRLGVSHGLPIVKLLLNFTSTPIPSNWQSMACQPRAWYQRKRDRCGIIV